MIRHFADIVTVMHVPRTMTKLNQVFSETFVV